MCKTKVVHYDYLPTLVDLAGGSASSLGRIDGVSLKPLLQGRDPGPALTDRALYFHYPHYRTSLPSSAIVYDGWKCLHFYETPGLKLLFDLERDLAEKRTAGQVRTTLRQADPVSEEHRRAHSRLQSRLRPRCIREVVQGRGSQRHEVARRVAVGGE